MRVRTEARREAILDTAGAVFMELGYEGASMVEIAARAGCSKVTLYGYFASKEDMFLEVIAHNMGREVDPALEQLASSGREDPAMVLKRFGERYLVVVLAPESIAMKRLIIAQLGDPELSRRFWALGPQRYLDAVETYLVKATRAGRLKVEDPKLAAQYLTALYEAETGVGGLFASGRVFTRDFIYSIVERAVDTFCKIYR